MNSTVHLPNKKLIKIINANTLIICIIGKNINFYDTGTIMTIQKNTIYKIQFIIEIVLINTKIRQPFRIFRGHESQ